MRAVLYRKPKSVSVETVDDPRIEDARDAIVRVTATAICGSDLHIYNGLLPEAKPFVLGHEFMGVVEEVGPSVNDLRPGDRVVVPFPVACGQCFFCSRANPVHCERSNAGNYGPEGGLLKQKGGGLFGYTQLYGGWDGGQAEFARVPFADVGPRKVPDGLRDEDVLFLTDVFPTGWTAIDWAELRGGETVAIFGAGPVGIMAAKAAWLRGAGRVFLVDLLDYRLEIGRNAGKAEVVDASRDDPVAVLRDFTEGRGPDVCVDAVGMEAHRSLLDKVKAAVHVERGTIDVLRTCFSAVRRGGTVSVVGVYGTHYDNFPFAQLFDKGLRLRAGQAPVHAHIDELLGLVADRKVALDDIITHRLPLAEAGHAYEIFNDKQDRCLKVVLAP